MNVSTYNSIYKEVVVYSTNSSNPKDIVPINYSTLVDVTEDQIQEIIAQAIKKQQ